MHLFLRPFLFSFVLNLIIVYSVAPRAIYSLQKAPVAEYFFFYEADVRKQDTDVVFLICKYFLLIPILGSL
jgi:hypothetical protein